MIERRPRSPNFPFVGLERARDLVESLLPLREGRFSAQDAAEIWDMLIQSSALAQRLSALVQFGLLDVEGRGAERRFLISTLARTVLSEPDATSLTKAALSPPIFRKLWEQLEEPQADRQSLVAYLTSRNPAYNARAAEDVLRTFAESVRFAGLKRPDDGPPTDPLYKDNFRDTPASDVLQEVTEWHGSVRMDGNAVRLRWRKKPSREDFENLRVWLEAQIKNFNQ